MFLAYFSGCGNVVSEWNSVGVGIEKAVEEIQGSIPKVKWDFEGIHYFDNGPLTVQYLFVLDALNFCFWPGELWIPFIDMGILLCFSFLFLLLYSGFLSSWFNAVCLNGCS